MGGTCNTHVEDEKCIQNFSRKTLGEEANWGGIGLDGRIILKCILEKQGVRVWVKTVSSGGLFWTR
jgi:hypothetical protein